MTDNEHTPPEMHQINSRISREALYALVWSEPMLKVGVRSAYLQAIWRESAPCSMFPDQNVDIGPNWRLERRQSNPPCLIPAPEILSNGRVMEIHQSEYDHCRNHLK